MESPTIAQALVILDEAKGKLDALFDVLSTEALVKPATIGGGDWSAKDLLGHLAFWEEIAIETVADWKSDRRPRFWALFEGEAGGVDGANARNQAITAAQSLEEVRARAAKSHVAVAQALQSLSEADWRSVVTSPTGDSETLADLIGGILGAPKRPFGHGFAHLADLEDYVKIAGPDKNRR
jgi:hypothetical protein